MGGGYLCVRMPRGLSPFQSGTSRLRTWQADWLQQLFNPASKVWTWLNDGEQWYLVRGVTCLQSIWVHWLAVFQASTPSPVYICTAERLCFHPWPRYVSHLWASWPKCVFYSHAVCPACCAPYAVCGSVMFGQDRCSQYTMFAAKVCLWLQSTLCSLFRHTGCWDAF